MSSLSIYKASAGSGKTFQLTRNYLELLFRAENNYSSILAVTFTNKAAAELKNRVLNELVLISSHELSSSDHYDYLSTVLNRKDDVLVPRAKKILLRILEDYSHFSIGTIDEFFQQVLRGFARELGVYSGYTIELSAKPLMKLAIDRLIENALNDPNLFDWLAEGISEKIEEGQAWRRFEKDLLTIGYELLRENYSTLLLNPEQELFPKAGIKAFRQKLKALEKNFEQTLKDIATQAEKAIADAGLTVDDFTRKSGGPAGFLVNLPDKIGDTEKKLQYLDAPEKWMPKATKKDVGAMGQQVVMTVLNPLLNKTNELYHTEYFQYKLAVRIRKDLIRLGLLSALAEQITEISREKGVFLISFTNPLIHHLINDNPAPFIYERTGRYFNNFMIDEFQDTSTLQWENFLPLIKEALASGGKTILVGDAKQSIYRWRNSNWKLIASQAVKDLHPFKGNEATLQKNYRSRQDIVDFNNQFFSHAAPQVVAEIARQLDDATSEPAASELEAFKKIYTDVRQDYGRRERGGWVTIDWVQEEMQDGFPAYYPALYELICDLQRDKGFAPNDIVFLIRKNQEATELIRYFDHQKEQNTDPDVQLDLIAAENFRLDSSPVVRSIISLLRLTTDPGNYPFFGRLAMDLLMSIHGTIPPESMSLLQRKSRKEIQHALDLDHLDGLMDELDQLDLSEKIERIIRELGLAKLAGALPFIFGLKEQIKSFTASGDLPTSSDLLEWWEDEGAGKQLTMDDQVEAMRVISIHKAKGLEFPVVIIPDCSWEFDHPATLGSYLWLKTAGTVYHDLPVLPIMYHKDLMKGPFSAAYTEEKIQIFLDNLNLLYVAFTRAVDHLHVFIPLPKKKKQFHVGDVVQEVVLREQDASQPDVHRYTFGDPDTKKRRKQGERHKNLILDDYPMGDMFSKTPEASYESPQLKRGQWLHYLMEQLVTADDLEPMMAKQVVDGQITQQEAGALMESIRRIIQKQEIRDYFSGKGKVLIEKSLMVPGYGEIRPDRVVIFTNRVGILEYKTGKEQSQYTRQLDSYRKALQDMGYLHMESYLVYLDTEEIVAV